MTTVPYDCPHCDTKKSGFQALSFYPVTGSFYFWVLLRCSVGECGRPITALVRPAESTKPLEFSPRDISVVFPKPQKRLVPQHLPEEVEKAFTQGLETLVEATADASGAMFRKALDRAITAIDAKRPPNLFRAIERLGQEGLITASLASWAHHIRLLGNDAAHDEFTFKEAEEMHSFAELVLTYLFTLPEMVKLKAPTEAKEDGV